MKGCRHYGVRGFTQSPNVSRPSSRMSFFNWKLICTSILAGATLAFSEALFKQYVRVTEPEGNSILPVKIQYKIKSHPLYQRLANIDTDNWQMIDSVNYPVGHFRTPDSLLTQFIAKPGGIMMNPKVFFGQDVKQTMSFVHLGYKMCGYPFLVHGGIIATLLNDFSKVGAYLLSSCTGDSNRRFKVKSLNIFYRYPTYANQVLAIKTFATESEHIRTPEKWIKSTILSEEGKILVECDAQLCSV